MNTADWKRKIRKLKQFEKSVRARENMGAHIPYVWDKFFDLRDMPDSKAMYSLTQLAGMGKAEYKHVLDDFFARVYYEVYIYKGLISDTIYDPAVLAQLGLPPVADEADVKKRFRELAKAHHPDAGGDAKQFIALMEVYKKLTNKAYS